MKLWNNISKYKIFKIKRTKFCMPLLLFVRAKYWDIQKQVPEYFFYIYNRDLNFEISCLEEMLAILKDYWANNLAEQTIDENEKKLYDKNISYHEYFFTILILERQRIIQQQINLTLIAIEILKRVRDKGMSIEFASLTVHEFEKRDSTAKNRVLLIPFFNRLKFYSNKT